MKDTKPTAFYVAKRRVSETMEHMNWAYNVLCTLKDVGEQTDSERRECMRQAYNQAREEFLASVDTFLEYATGEQR